MTVADLPQANGSRPTSKSFMALANLDQAVIDAFPQAVYLCAGDGRLVRFNAKAAELWGRSPTPGDPAERFCGSHRLYRTDGTWLPHDQCPMATALGTGEPCYGQEVIVERPDGGRSTILVNIAAIRDEQGQVSGAINSFQDISDRKLEEERRRHLIQELNHRVKNTLATVHSMAAFTVRDASSLEDFIERFEARLVALSRAQALLSNCEEHGAGLSVLLAEQLEPFGGGDSSRVRFAGPDVDLPPAKAFSLCMVFHELMTNAAKYGALSVETGQVAIDWNILSRSGDGRSLTVQWLESGGPVVDEPTRSGFGTRLIQRTITGLGGQAELRFAPSGLQMSATIPLGN